MSGLRNIVSSRKNEDRGWNRFRRTQPEAVGRVAEIGEWNRRRSSQVGVALPHRMILRSRVQREGGPQRLHPGIGWVAGVRGANPGLEGPAIYHSPGAPIRDPSGQGAQLPIEGRDRFVRERISSVASVVGSRGWVGVRGRGLGRRRALRCSFRGRDEGLHATELVIRTGSPR